MPNFGNPGSALSALGGQMKAKGKSLQNRGGGMARSGMSARQHRKMVGNLVDAHRAMNETETLHHGQRLEQSADAVIRMREAGFANVSSETAHVKLQGTGKVRPTAGSKEDAEARAYNPSAAEHGHPFAGHPFGNGTRPVMQLPTSSVVASSATVIPEATPKAIGAPRKALPAPAKPFTANSKGDVFTPGAKVVKTPTGPERTFTVGKRGTARETTPGATPNAIAKKRPLKSSYDGPSAYIASKAKDN